MVESTLFFKILDIQRSLGQLSILDELAVQVIIISLTELHHKISCCTKVNIFDRFIS